MSIADAQSVDDESGRLPFITVAIGASAGGVEALTRLFANSPTDGGCAYVVVMHLPAERESLLAHLLSRATTMQVQQVQDGMALAPDCVYVGPPAHYVEVRRGQLCLVPIGPRPPKPSSVDRLLASLAVDQRERAIGVVLTGSDADGALGIKAIKAEGGLTIAQTPDSAAHPGMPRSAVATGVVDLQLPIEEIPGAIARYVADAGPRGAVESQPILSTLPAILEALLDQTGLDFRGYKTPMLHRRVRRRMGLTRTRDLEAYLLKLRSAPEEASALATDFLISVTEFFREPESWEVLEHDILPELLDRKTPGDAVRVWVPACATGEEAYGLAMVFLEQPAMAERRLRLQVFGTDIDRPALEVCRKGRYPQTIEHTVSPARLQRFFVKQGEEYQVRKELRDTLLFAPQNVVSDPPFSHMDLVTCRNLLIYMEPHLQRRVLQMFHFALEADGILTLGKSETVGQQTALFSPTSQRARVYRRIGATRTSGLKPSTAPSWRPDEAGRATPPAQRDGEYAALVREALAGQRAAAAILTNREGRCLYFHGKAQPFLDLPEGVPTTDVYAMLRQELRPTMRAALHKAAHANARVELVSPLGLPEGELPVRVTVSPVMSPGQDLMLATFELLDAEEHAALPVLSSDEASALRALEQELRDTKRELRTTIEELESTNEELKVANEEAMSMNEELQSANEELETSKEELQSVNEELITVNNQLQEKVLELEAVNDDLGNLLSSTHTPTLFLDRQLRIKRYTPAATRLFRLIATDLNRPLADIAGRTDTASLLDDARAVLHNLAPREQEVRSDNGEYFLRRTLPYRTLEDRIDGIVVTFTDISEIKRAAEGLHRYAAVSHASNDAIIVHDLQGGILAWNAAAQVMYGHAEADVLNTNITQLLPPEARSAYAQQMERLLAGARLQGIESIRQRRDGSTLEVSSTISLVHDAEGRPAEIALIERDVTPKKRAEAVLRESEQRFRSLADGAPALMWMCDGAGVIEFANREFATVVGFTPQQLSGRRWVELLHPDEKQKVLELLQQGRDEKRIEATVQLRTARHEFRWMKAALIRRDDGSGLIGSMVEIDTQVRAERDLRLANKRKDEFLAMLGHELRNPLVPIRNAAELLNHVQSDDARVSWVRNTLVRQVEHVTRLVDDLLDISMITRSTMRLHREPADLGHVVRRAVESSNTLMQRKRHRFEWQLAPEALWVDADAIRLTQVFENLLTNAAKYSDEGGEIRLEVRQDGAEAVVTVTDDGLGISPEMLPRVFDLFVQDERAIDRSQGGLGIGLSLVRHLVQLHGGQVTVHSEGIGRGSEFVVRLPLIPAASAPPPTLSAEESLGGRVLIVDDDADGAESMQMLLESLGYDVRYAANLTEALQAGREFRPQIVLLDIAMPEADGYEVAARLRALPEMAHNPAYLALSGFGQPDDLRKSAAAGFARHFVKPVNPADLTQFMQTLLGQAG